MRLGLPGRDQLLPDQQRKREIDKHVAVQVPQLTPSGRWTQAGPEEALSTVARLAVELLSGPDVPLLKECGNPECTRIYIDRSRGMRRQWCGMESCGNKIKAAAYRARKKSVSP